MFHSRKYTPGGILTVLVINYFHMNSHTAGSALAITLVVLFILCAVAQMIFPNFQATHMWLNLFSGAEVGSARLWVEGVLVSALAGYLSGFVFAKSYNLVA